MARSILGRTIASVAAFAAVDASCADTFALPALAAAIDAAFTAETLSAVAAPDTQPSAAIVAFAATSYEAEAAPAFVTASNAALAARDA